MKKLATILCAVLVLTRKLFFLRIPSTMAVENV